MFLEFFFKLRKFGVPAATHEWMALMRAMGMGLHGSSLDGFYELSRMLCVKDVAHYDAFDAAFLETFRDIPAGSLFLTEQIAAWLADPKRAGEYPAGLNGLDLDELRRLFEERLKEQKERHDGGNHWIGTGGTSPFGRGGQHPSGLRVGDRPPGKRGSAMQVASERRYRDYRKDVVLDVRRLDVALRALRDLGREGAPDELDLDETIEETARNVGDIELVMHPPRRNRTKVILLMDVGGSMDPFAFMVERLFTAASRAGRFARFRHYYFHNCVYESVFEDANFSKPISVIDLIGDSDRSEKLVIVGDAAMHPVELMERGGSIYFYARNSSAGIDWMRRLSDHFRRTAWLNPEPPGYWGQTTVRILRDLFPMFPLTVDGVEQAVKKLR